LAFDQTTEKAFGCTLLAAALHQNINNIAGLIHSAPEVKTLSLDGDKHFVAVSGVAETSLSLFEFSRMGQAELLAPLTNGFVVHCDASFGEQFFDFTETQGESMVLPGGMADNF